MFKIEPVNEALAKLQPMGITLHSTKKRVKVNVGKYPAKRRRFSDAYFDEFMKMGFLKVCRRASGHGPPSLVANVSKYRYITTIVVHSYLSELLKLKTRRLARL